MKISTDKTHSFTDRPSKESRYCVKCKRKVLSNVVPYQISVIEYDFVEWENGKFMCRDCFVKIDEVPAVC